MSIKDGSLPSFLIPSFLIPSFCPLSFRRSSYLSFCLHFLFSKPMIYWSQQPTVEEVYCATEHFLSNPPPQTGRLNCTHFIFKLPLKCTSSVHMLVLNCFFTLIQLYSLFSSFIVQLKHTFLVRFQLKISPVDQR